jgi:transcriptional regulator with XRE-family HTH domain
VLTVCGDRNSYTATSRLVAPHQLYDGQFGLLLKLQEPTGYSDESILKIGETFLDTSESLRHYDSHWLTRGMGMDSVDIGANALGHRIAQLREQSGLKQAELARRVTWSPAVLSRVEAGERELVTSELADLLDAIGSPEAAALSEIVMRRWEYIAAPPLDHPDQDLLWAAEKVAVRLAAQAAADDTRPAFLKRLDEYQAELSMGAERLLRRQHSVAFVGPIGIGKSTAICRATGLSVVSGDGKSAPVLETGGGGITLCEVSLKAGPGYGIIVTPRTTEEVRADVEDFADQLRRRTEDVSTDSEEAQRAVPREIERAIRNMSGLRPTRRKGEDGKTIRSDPAKELASSLPSARDLVVEILSRMELPSRDRRDLWYDPKRGTGPLEWLKATFEQVNNGRHPDFALPAHVDLIVPELTDTGDLTVDIIDTRGIDQLTARADLESHLLDSHTVSVLCSGFNDAPEQSVQHLLERARAIGNPQVETHTAVLVLARPDEALAVKDESGLRADTEADGYELKGEQVSNALSPYGLAELPVEFFNSFSDDPARLRRFILERVNSTREGFRRTLRTVVLNAEELLANVELQQVIEVQKDSGRHMQAWLDNHVSPPPATGNVHDMLMAEIKTAHPSTLNATVRREGEWDALSYSHQLGFGARRVAVASLDKWKTEFIGICNNLLVTHPEASELLNQAVRLMDTAYEDLLKKMQVAGGALYRSELQRAQVLWLELGSEWGTGPGYRDRVTTKQNAWFNEADQAKVEREVLGILAREWEAARERVAAIIDTE